MGHMAEARLLSERLGGMDVEVKRYFLALPPEDLDKVFAAYGEKYGPEKRKYARATFQKWKSGQTQMSGQIAERLFDVLPPLMPIDLKLRIVEGLFEASWRAHSDYILAPMTASPQSIIAFVEARCFRDLGRHQISDKLKEQFGWLAGDDAKVAEQILQYSLNLTARAKTAAAAAIMQQVDQIRQAHGDVVQNATSVIKIKKQEIHIKRSKKDHLPIRSVDSWTFHQDGRPEPQKIDTWVWIAGAGLLLLIFFSQR